MRIARLGYDDGKETYGIVSGDRVATRDEITYSTGVPIPAGIKDFLFDGWLEEVRPRLPEFRYEEELSRFRVLHPVPNPPKIVCMAFNYADHAREQNLAPPEDPVLVIKPRTALTGTGSDIVCPEFVTQLDYEIELALVIGKTVRNIEGESEALDAVFGYTVFNDVSARDLQFKDGQFTRGKGCDTFAPCGPWVTTKDEVGDPHGLRLVTRINGEVRQDSSTAGMSIRIPQIVSKISRCMTVERGDIIATGTPAGVALNSPGAGFLRDGDRIEMEIEGLGKLSNTVRVKG